MLTVEDLRIPRSYEIIAGADTGTYMSGLIAAISPEYELFCLEEFPNYHYVGDGTIELIGLTVREWMHHFADRMKFWTKQRKFGAWADANTTFKTEVGFGLSFKMNKKVLELRTEITREYMRHNRVHVAPWLKVLPYEMEIATFPEHESAGTGRYQRIKIKDHTLDCLEHICSRRPHPNFALKEASRPRALDAMLAKFKRTGRTDPIDPHLGAQ